MTKTMKVVLSGALFAYSAMAFSNDLEGVIESVNQESQSFVVEGIELYTNERTDYDDGLKSFSDLQQGQTVEVDFSYEGGKHYASEIELEHR